MHCMVLHLHPVSHSLANHSRIWALGNTKVTRLLAILIVLLGLAQSLAAIVGAIIIEENLTQERLLEMHPIFTFWLAGALVTDTLIAATMIWILRNAKSGLWISETDTLLNRLIMNTFRTGTVTVVAATVELALFLRFTDTNYHIAFVYILGKLYTTSFMVTLNMRTPRLKRQPESFLMHLPVSRPTEGTQASISLGPPGRDTVDWKRPVGDSADSTQPSREG
ncbi:hypothetical protein B0H15DRAFT_833498 [Mycena belliarum]|uniref:DUF6534 domain-containing protein n=1 Tax=Mycena belliarum TaxID=1033014 RepID=A0AAD6U8Z8_9AGAR|nr:hypothetical protein B0H15DRAFT_833498 [Mycena belliae]